MIFDGFVNQLPDSDPGETQEWLDIARRGRRRRTARPEPASCSSKLLDRARASQVSFPATVSTPYVNTIPREHEPWFPGDEYIERRIRAFVRWNAAVMVVRANKHADGIGGHLSTFASSASLYEIGFNHFFRGKDDGNAGDHVYFQGHAAPGIYARAFMEGRLTEDDLDHFRREIGRGGRGLSSYPHPRLMPEFWEFPTVTMGLGPLTALYQARFNRYLPQPPARRHQPEPGVGVPRRRRVRRARDARRASRWPAASSSTTWSSSSTATCSASTARCAATARSSRSSRPSFRGAGWNVIKVIRGSKWDELLAKDKDGVLLNKMNTTVDGQFQRYSIETGDYIRDHFFGPDPRLRQMVAHLTDDDLRNLPRGGHDYRKLYAAYKAATENLGSGRADGRSCARRSRAGRSAPASRAATPPTRSRR